MFMPQLEFVDEGTVNSQRVAVLEANEKLGIRFAKIPTIRSDEILIRVLYNGICGSDLEAFRGTRSPEWVSHPSRLGHEVSGIIDQVGSDVIALKVGDKVTTRYVWGALAEFIVCKPFNVKVLPPAFPMLEISLIEVLPGIIHAAELGRITPHTNVLVMGQGVSGLVLTQILKLYSPKSLVVTDLKQRNLELAKKYGATHTYMLPSEHASTMATVGKDFPDGFEVVIPCLLDGDGMKDALESCSVGARIVMYGCIGTCSSFDFFKMHRKRVEIYSTEPRRDVDMRKYFQEGITYVLDGLVNTSEMITHIYPINRVQDAFLLRNNKSKDIDAIHVLVDCQSKGNDIVTRI
jgi:threonine dehydrogenase-like Zn-dependent dehydrogenase